ncbi:Gfo/Idh/MocA family oxidoreductase [Starkeya koreensis]|uniref:Gfo/Idh/MocA family oxidoreductase n=1 Tax=Ancylobacter koreensis TaxID=266121 RepID=A0ABT0DPH8_9HYPH|nr:Gfo/Idh/MocA family oxidoreductase [Ancylobacter koreensis]MCK0209165.1 Gfo/Idh/MocA family oxidoreductase [Ancylobacter koreensis]
MVQGPSGAVKPVRVGVVGVGIMGYNHARVLGGLPDAELVGIADPDQAQREKVAAMLGCAGFASLDDLVAAGAEALVIAAPTHLHHDVTLAAIAAGRHVLVEKPIAPTVAEGEAIVAAARAKGVALMVGHVERFNPAVEAVKNAIRDQEILSIGITRVGPFPPRMSNVGVVIDLAVHDIDLICHFTGSHITEVQPQVKAAVAEREDIALLQFRTANGVLAHINTNWLTPFKARTVHVATRQKYVIGDLLTRQVTEYFDYKPDGSYSMRHLPVAYAEPLRLELTRFLEAVRGERAPAVTGEDGVAAIATAMRCLATPESSADPVPLRAAG